MNVLIVRHGETAANRQRRYCGQYTDIPLSEEGRAAVVSARQTLQTFASTAPVSSAIRRQLVSPVRVAVSPLLRAVQTAHLLFPASSYDIVPGFSEMDFGLFENRNADELTSDHDASAAYRIWVDSGCTLACPPSAVSPGESAAAFKERTCNAFLSLVKAHEDQLITIVAHGGTQMALFDRFCSVDRAGLSYYDWQTPCAGFRFGVFAV